jgi:hypothetical protein
MNEHYDLRTEDAMAIQYEDDVLGQFFLFADVDEFSDTGHLLRGLLGGSYRTDFKRFLANNPNSDRKSLLANQASVLGTYYASQANTGRTPAERLAWAQAQFAGPRRKRGNNKCLLCARPGGKDSKPSK